MHSLFFIIIGFLYFETANSYVVLQVDKQNDNLSNEGGSDISFKRYDNQGPKFSSRKHLSSRHSETTTLSPLESIVLAVDTGVKHLLSSPSRPDIVDTIAKSLVDFAKNTADPNYRSKGQEYNIKPEIIHFRSNQPSVMFEINSRSIINVLRDLLQSKVVHKYMDRFSKEAAVVYRAIKDELDKPQPRQHRRQ